MVNPVALPPGRARLATNPAPTGSMTTANTIGCVRLTLQQRRYSDGTSCHDDFRRGRNQFGRMFANLVGIGRGPANVDPHVAAVNPAQLLQTLQQSRNAGL